MPSDVKILQHADIKVLMPILKEAMHGSDSGGLHLNMVGPIYIGGAQSEAKERELLAPVAETGTDDLFDCEVPMQEFIERAKGRYFRLICVRCNFEHDQVVKTLKLGSPQVYNYARRYGVKFSSKKSGGGRLLAQGGKKC